MKISFLFLDNSKANSRFKFFNPDKGLLFLHVEKKLLICISVVTSCVYNEFIAATKLLVTVY